MGVGVGFAGVGAGVEAGLGSIGAVVVLRGGAGD